MKRLLFLACVLLAFAADAEDKEISLTWNAPTTYSNGATLPESDIKSYKCFYRQQGDTGFGFAGYSAGNETSGTFTMDVQLDSVVETTCRTVTVNGRESVDSNIAMIVIPPDGILVPNPPDGLQGFLE